MGSTRDDSVYRRGVVLGLTMAEIMLLLLFVLMLALSLLVERKTDEIVQKEQQLTQKKEELADRRKEIAELSRKMDELVRTRPTEQAYSDVFRELVLIKEQKQRVEQKVAALEEKVEQAQAAAIEAEQKAKAFDELAASTDGRPTPKDMRQALDTSKQADRLTEIAEKAGLPSDPEKLRQALKETAQVREAIKELAGDKKQAEERLEFFKRRAGLSNEMPPCWIHPETSRAEYIFDVVLDTEGLILFARDLPHRRDDKRRLPLEPVEYRKVLSTDAFADDVRPLYQWSVNEGCRFYVRVFDRTAPDEKPKYKRLLRSVEGYFYKYLVTDGSEQPGTI